MYRIFLMSCLLAGAGCNSEIYVRDGVTDGDTFYLSDRALIDNDPVLQSWVAYSLAKSTCQLEIGGANPARNSSYGCELTSRKLLLDTWSEKGEEYPGIEDAYLDELAATRQAGLLDEYVVHFYGKREWLVPAEVDRKKFRKWRRQHLRSHKPETHIIGSWNYAHKD